MGLLNEIKGLKEDLGANVIPVDISSPTAHFHLLPQEVWRESDFPNCISPFNRAFYEYKMPNFSTESGKRKRLSNAGTQFGFCVESVKLSYDEAMPLVTVANPFYLKDLFNYRKSTGDQTKAPDEPQIWNNFLQHYEGLKYPAFAQKILIGFRLLDKFIPVMTFYDFLSDSGEIMLEYPNLKEGHTLRTVKISKSGRDLFLNNGQTEEMIIDFGLEVVLPLFFSISLLHCKNVIVKDQVVPEKLRAANEKRRGIPQTTYKTLVIDEIRKKLKTEGNEEKNGLKKALHICRGHFRTYEESSKLFGKLTGTYWIPMHTKGDIESGKVEKDYKLKRTKTTI